MQLLAAGTLVCVAFQPLVSQRLGAPALRSEATIFIAICVQALPFLALGVVISGCIAAFVTPSQLGRLLPRSPVLAVPVAGVAGMALPGCECGSVPIAGRLVERGVQPAAALTFLLSAPAINPVVLVATSVAFPGRPALVLARFVASLLTAVVTGWLWSAFGKSIPLRLPRMRTAAATASRWGVFTDTALHDFLHAGGYLVFGALAAATLQTAVPRSVLDRVGSNGVTAVAAMAVLAVLLAVCSEADAFVASGLTSFSITARLVFLVVGPAVDVKLVALQAGTFGRRFALRFAPLTFVVAVGVACLTGWLLL